MNTSPSGYGLWLLVVLNSAVFIMFAFSFFKPQTGRDWRTFGAFTAFIVALFVEMYGFPLTLYLLSGWLQTRFPQLDLMSHDSGHLWSTLMGARGDPHLAPLHLASYVFLGYGFYLLSCAWHALYQAQRRNELAVAGPYARIRHPQYVAFVLILLGFLLQWPTLLTLLMFPVLLVMYARLAASEETELRQRFGAAYDAYAARTPRFLPRVAAGPSTTAALVLVALAVAAPGAMAQAAPGAAAAAQTSAAGGVTVKVTPVAGRALEFSVVFDTHSSDLRDDLLQAATLTTGAGRKLKPARWTGAAPGGHHREGVLAFDGADPGAGPIELAIQRPGEPAPRIFRWQR